MCYTTTVIHSLCGHSKTEVRENARCAIGFSDPISQFHWRAPEGICHRDGMCLLCQTRLKRYGCLTPNQLEQLSQATRSSLGSSGRGSGSSSVHTG